MSQDGADYGMDVYYWNYPGCQYSMTTNHFELPPGASVSISLDLSQCVGEDVGLLLFFGYNTTKTRSRQFSSRNRMFLSITDSSGEELASSDDGSVIIEQKPGMTLTLHAQNLNRSKVLKIRLQSEAGL
jgi:hypothetical protein